MTGNELREIRERFDFSQSDMALRVAGYSGVRVSGSDIQAWEAKGKRSIPRFVAQAVNEFLSLLD
jgi:DNA-binding transcriptional regulator YiaG